MNADHENAKATMARASVYGRRAAALVDHVRGAIDAMPVLLAEDASRLMTAVNADLSRVEALTATGTATCSALERGEATMADVAAAWTELACIAELSVRRLHAIYALADQTPPKPEEN